MYMYMYMCTCGSAIFLGPNLFINLYETKRGQVDAFSGSGPVSELSLIVHNLCWERPILKLKYALLDQFM